MNFLFIFLIIYISILIHELGHYLVARRLNIMISVFCIGFGPKVLEFRRAGTVFRFCLLPLGGYVLPNVCKASPWNSIPLKKRICFTLGGPTINLLFGTILYLAMGVGNFYPSESMLRTMSLLGILTHINEIMYSPANVLYFSASLNLSIGLLNLIPMPPLDGSKLALDILSKVWPDFLKYQTQFFKLGLVCILLISLSMSARDVFYYFPNAHTIAHAAFAITISSA